MRDDLVINRNANATGRAGARRRCAGRPDRLQATVGDRSRPGSQSVYSLAWRRDCRLWPCFAVPAVWLGLAGNRQREFLLSHDALPGKDGFLHSACPINLRGELLVARKAQEALEGRGAGLCRQGRIVVGRSQSERKASTPFGDLQCVNLPRSDRQGDRLRVAGVLAARFGILAHGQYLDVLQEGHRLLGNLRLPAGCGAEEHIGHGA